MSVKYFVLESIRGICAITPTASLWIYIVACRLVDGWAG